MKNFHAGWYLIYTKPRHEKKVHTRLTEMKINSFLPLTKKLRIWHDRKKIINEPLFPSYVFIYLDDLQAYYEGIDTDGSLYYVRTGKEIARVNDIVINNIRILVDKGSEIEVLTENIQPSQEFLIRQGPLTGLSCEIVQVSGSHKVLVRVHLLQRNLLVTLPSDYLTQPLHSEEPASRRHT
ncbi:MAG TPA: UpxY family transcription antiterminator [Puia sp.]|nr:UpxY family transcription antiterminator [Puia sp.]